MEESLNNQNKNKNKLQLEEKIIIGVFSIAYFICLCIWLSLL